MCLWSMRSLLYPLSKLALKALRRGKFPPNICPKYKVNLNKFFWTISAGFLIHVTAKQGKSSCELFAKVRANAVAFLDFGWVFGPLSMKLRGSSLWTGWDNIAVHSHSLDDLFSECLFHQSPSHRLVEIVKMRGPRKVVKHKENPERLLAS